MSFTVPKASPTFAQSSDEEVDVQIIEVDEDTSNTSSLSLTDQIENYLKQSNTTKESLLLKKALNQLHTFKKHSNLLQEENESLKQQLIDSQTKSMEMEEYVLETQAESEKQLEHLDFVTSESLTQKTEIASLKNLYQQLNNDIDQMRAEVSALINDKLQSLPDCKKLFSHFGEVRRLVLSKVTNLQAKVEQLVPLNQPKIPNDSINQEVVEVLSRINELDGEDGRNSEHNLVTQNDAKDHHVFGLFMSCFNSIDWISRPPFEFVGDSGVRFGNNEVSFSVDLVLVNGALVVEDRSLVEWLTKTFGFLVNDGMS
ncbi:hypothetical protein P9112_001886 [Eukaryota sp. TZLM1-RC]